MLTADKPTPLYTSRELQRCAEREVTLRKQVYPNRVFTGRMTQQLADSEIRKMQAIADHFAELAKQERLL
jgi:hypothetical protein